MQEGPWAFKVKAVVIAPYEGFTRPSSIALNKMDIWMQIHDLLDGYFSKVKALSATVGEFIYAEPKSSHFEGNFCRVHVKVDVTKPLKNAVSLVVNRKQEVIKEIFAGMVFILQTHLSSKIYKPPGSKGLGEDLVKEEALELEEDENVVAVQAEARGEEEGCSGPEGVAELKHFLYCRG
ncbi:hypothetical protein D1007_55566 [Hordeum vulgare]|nr:hypothetical protein D1007_55566 [Hordeum vulgare]